jgi:tetratricopeptide (TPR) repeat protein
MRSLALLILSAAASLATEHPGLDRAARVRGLLQRHEYRAALELARALHRERPDDIAAYQFMAAAHLGLGNYPEAEKELQWMLDLRVGRADSHGWLLLARFREVTGDIEGALDAVNQGYQRLTPGQEADGRTLLAYAARLHYLAGRLDLANQALAAAGDDPAAKEVLAGVRLAQGNRPEAIRILRELAPLHPRFRYLLATATGQAADFAAFEQAALACAASSDNANRELALYYAGKGNHPAKALDFARRERANRHDVFTKAALAVALFVNGKTGRARSEMNSVLAVGTRDPQILAHAARIGVNSQ